jgi:hypothetical protein
MGFFDLIEKDVKGSGCAEIKVICCHLPRGTEEIHEKYQVRTASLLADI